MLFRILSGRQKAGRLGSSLQKRRGAGFDTHPAAFQRRWHGTESNVSYPGAPWMCGAPRQLRTIGTGGLQNHRFTSGPGSADGPFRCVKGGDCQESNQFTWSSVLPLYPSFRPSPNLIRKVSRHRDCAVLRVSLFMPDCSSESRQSLSFKPSARLLGLALTALIGPISPWYGRIKIRSYVFWNPSAQTIELGSQKDSS